MTKDQGRKTASIPIRRSSFVLRRVGRGTSQTLSEASLCIAIDRDPACGVGEVVWRWSSAGVAAAIRGRQRHPRLLVVAGDRIHMAAAHLGGDIVCQVGSDAA